MCLFIVQAGENSARIVDVTVLGDVTVLVLVGGASGGETPRVADSSAAGAGRFFHNSVPPSKQSRARLASGFLADRRSSGLVLARTTGGLGREAATALRRVRGLL